MNKNIKLIRFEITASIILLSLVEIALYQYAAFQISKDFLQSIIFAISVILILWLAKRYINRIELPVLIFMFLFNVMANLQKLGLDVKEKSLEETRAEFCQLRKWQKCQVQTMANIGQPDNRPRKVSWSEARKVQHWDWDQWETYKSELPESQKKWDEAKAKIDRDNKDFLALTPKTFSQLEKMSKSFNSLSTQETMWLVLRLVFGLFISIILVGLFEKCNEVWKPIEIEVRKVDSVEVEAIQKMALLKNPNRHWKFRNPISIAYFFPNFPEDELLKIVFSARAKARAQKDDCAKVRQVAPKCAQNAALTGANVNIWANYHEKYKN
jgi:hypothetical protein